MMCPTAIPTDATPDWQEEERRPVSYQFSLLTGGPQQREGGREVSEPELVLSSHFPLITGTDILRLLVGQTEQHATSSNLQI